MPTENALWGDDWPAVRARWALDPDVAHLNHGSFGAPPVAVDREQDRWRARAAANPMRAQLIDQPVGIAAARARAEDFLGAVPGSLALVPNVTTAVSTVLAAVELGEADEVVVTDHGYGAVRLALDLQAGRTGARVVEVALDVHASDDDVRAAIGSAVGSRTRLVVIDHVSSSTARRLPVQGVVDDLRGSGVAVLVDAAHAPGQLPLDLAVLDADFWTGNFHKWACAARSTAALVVAERWRERVAPVITSWNAPAGFPVAFDLSGTQDHSAWLALGAALDELETLGWERLPAHGPALAAYGQQVLATALGTDPDELWGDDGVWMRCVPLAPGLVTTRDETTALWLTISDRLRCEVGVGIWRGRGILRVSAHAYNAPSEYERLAAGIRTVL